MPVVFTDDRHVVKRTLNIQNGTVHITPAQDSCPIIHTESAPLLFSIFRILFYVCVGWNK